VGYSLKVIILPDEDAGGLVLTSSTTFKVGSATYNRY